MIEILSVFFSTVIYFAFGIVILFFIGKAISEADHKDSSEGKYYIDEDGYFRFNNSGKLLHRYIASKKIGRRLRRDEVVHHIDRNKKNNHSDNLYVCYPEEHQAIHTNNLKEYGYW